MSAACQPCLAHLGLLFGHKWGKNPQLQSKPLFCANDLCVENFTKIGQIEFRSCCEKKDVPTEQQQQHTPIP